MPLVSSEPAAAHAQAWRRFGLSFAAVALGLAAALYAFAAAIDPYGARVRPGAAARPIMDLNQRFMYPQIVRSGRHDSAVFGTSTVRLLDPRELDMLFAARFANLGLNAGTPWEQMQLAALFLRHVPRPKVLVLGLDATWCEPDADRKRVTFRAFPPWLYDEDLRNDWAGFLSLKSLEIAGRVVLNRLGLMPPRIGADGFEVFVPPESAYDLARARAHIHRNPRPDETRRDHEPSQASLAELPMPALPWLDELLARVPPEAESILLFPPIHAAAQPPAGSREEAVDRECKARISAIAAARGALLVDFRRRSAITTEDSNYWDPLHYRVGIASRIAAALREAAGGKSAPPDGFYRVLAAAPRSEAPIR
ncbi:MAG TPA: hypothetical protein VE443_08700 [Beijerinckiaceae bacterium]|jgi:hypothetical protein|nr:hypothetical protein [Microvirga sp.]HZB38063.1 hypothetical protein [Beijerinckiaceae bacterium]